MKKYLLLALLACASIGAQAGWERCKNCNGLGHFDYDGGYGLNDHNYKTCPNCGREVDMFNHSCDCQKCGGKGKIWVDDPKPKPKPDPDDGHDWVDPDPESDDITIDDGHLTGDYPPNPVPAELMQMQMKVQECLTKGCVYQRGPCQICHATGLCPICEGKGSKNGLMCLQCHMQGKCYWCGGAKEADNGYRLTESGRVLLENCMELYRHLVNLFAASAAASSSSEQEEMPSPSMFGLIEDSRKKNGLTCMSSLLR